MVLPLLLLAAAGCSGGHAATPRPTASLTIPRPSPSATGRPRLVRAGAQCGEITTISGARARVTVVRGHTTCAEALRVFQKYNDPGTPAEGTAGLVVIGQWTCQTRRATTGCASRAATIRAGS